MSAQRRPFIQDTIALVYDFDGTLSPQPMQEYTVLPEIGVAPSAFWEEVNRQARANDEEAMLTYMRLIVEQANEKRVHIGREELKRLGRNVKYFPGVTDWFEHSNRFVAEHGGGRIKLRHYIISAGLKEILEGVSIKRHFSNIFASEYHYDHHKVATFPKLLITDTTKTQFLFRINKGREGLGESINTHMATALRPIPFENMIYIGDGETDVPSMTVTRQQGGSSIAVYKTGRGPHERQTQAICKTLLEAGRVNFIAPADYSPNSVLANRVQLLLRSVMARIEYQRELHNCRREHGIGA